MTPPTTPIERLATGLTIIAQHDPSATPGFVFAFGEGLYAVDVQSRGDDAMDTALRAIGWEYRESEDGCAWEFPLP